MLFEKVLDYEQLKSTKKKIGTPDCSPREKKIPLPLLIFLLILLDVDFLYHERVKDSIIGEKKREECVLI